LIVKDIATGQLVEIENDLDDLELYGYEEAITNDDSLWFSAQDPAWLERKRLDKRGEIVWNFDDKTIH
tara:strand:- start:259 stop:462 length:204 start_codon:yes stop_codon:yes gene_type:complete